MVFICGAREISDCVGLGVTGIHQYHRCHTLNGTDLECQLEFPCEVREFLHSISAFIVITRIVLSYGTVFIIVLGLILNSLSFYTLISSGLVKSGSGIYLVSLAVCDCGNLIANYGVGVARGQLPRFNQLFMETEWLCRAHAVFVDIFQLISAWIVVSFTVERCIAVWYPMVLRHASRVRRARSVVFGLTTVLASFSMSKLFLTGFESDSVFGYPPCQSRRIRWAGMAYVRVAFQTWIPTIMVFVFNCLMFYKLQRAKTTRKRLTAHRPASTGQTVWRAPGRLQDTRRQGFARRPNNTSKMLIAVSLAYLVLVFPLGVIQTVELCWNVHHKPPSVLHHSPDESEESCLQNYVHWKSTKLLLKYIRSFCFGFYQINFAINFFLYFAAGLQFRLHLQHKMKCFLNRFPPRLLLWCHGTIDDRDCSGEHCAGGTSGRITVTRLFRSKTTTPATSRASVSTTSVRCIDENSEPACSNLPSGNPTEEEVAVRTLSGVISTDDAALSSESIRLGVLGQPATDLDTDMQSCEETISDF